MRRRTLAGIAALVIVNACGSGGGGSQVPAASSAEVGRTTVPAQQELSASNGRDLVLAWVNGASVSKTEYGELFDGAFRRQVPYGEFETLLSEIAAQAPWVVGEVVEDDEFTTEFVATSETGEGLIVSIAIDADSGRFTGLLFEPDTEFDVPASVLDAIERLRSFGTVRLLVADASGGSCAPLVDEKADEVMPLGSVFKLYVLGAVVAAVGDGVISWDQPVVIDDALDSLPSGDTQDLEPGTERTVRQLAEAMISASDNTATDHLIALLGREAVEAVLDDMGNDAIEQNTPFLGTREFFIIKWGPDGLANGYRDADESERRALLDGEVANGPLPTVDSLAPDVPVQVEEVEWFASPRALCQALVWLAGDETATEILAIFPGIPDESDRWSQILFKGGSEPGVVAVAWLTRADDGTTQVTSGSVVNSDEPINETDATQLFAHVRDHAG